jgi:protein-glucosylgalactosylhydroxylysine glucosidase
MSTYDNQWTITYSNAGTPISADEPGIFLGNGKVGMTTSFDQLDVQNTMITTQLRYYNGSYKANIVDPFYTNHVKFFDNKPENVTMTMREQSLNMFTAIFTSKHTVTETVSNKTIDVECDLYTPRQLPFCTVQTLKLTPTQDMSELLFFHEAYTKDNITDVEYNNNVIYNETINPDKGLYILSGKGRTRNTSDVVVCACAYLMEMPESDYENLGFNIYRNDLNRCYNKFKLKNLIAGTQIKIHIVSAHMTSFDFEGPGEEVKRIVLNIANKASTMTEVAARVRSDHCAWWADLWETDITIAPKVGITVEEADELNYLKRHIRFSLYNIYSSVRENVNVEVNPLNLSVIDFDGSVLYDGDLWLIPLLLIMKPDVARALLEYRYKLIDIARQLAAGYGFKGAKFPYVNDSIGYKNALYWDTVGPMSVFNTALISINVWNYFRITRDRDWLQSKGYVMLKDNADFFASKIDKDADGSFHLRNVVGVNGVESADQNAFTNNLVRLALRYCIEASYELSYPVKSRWQECYYGLPVLFHGVPNNQVIKYDVNATDASLYNIIEPLFNLIPGYSYLFWVPEASHNRTAIRANIDYYAPKVQPSTQHHPFNIALLACCYGQYAQYDSNYVANYKVKLYEFLTCHTSGIWGNLTTQNKKKNDVVLNAILVCMLVMGMCQVTVAGGVAETRFYYEEMRVTSLTSANMPPTWRNVKVAGTGTNLGTLQTTNTLYYMPGSLIYPAPPC